jgi:hypothetical protein
MGKFRVVERSTVVYIYEVEASSKEEALVMMKSDEGDTLTLKMVDSNYDIPSEYVVEEA